MPAEDSKIPAKAKRSWYVTRREKVIFGSVAGLLIAGTVALRALTGYQTVWIVNGLDVPAKVEIDGREREIAAQGKESERLSGGLHEVRVRSAFGEVLEERTIDVQPMNDAAVYNVLGAAPLYIQKVVYSSSSYGQNNNAPNAVEVLAGASFITRDGVEYVFEQPPQTIQVKSRGQSIVKWMLGLAPGGATSTLNYLANQGKLADTLRLTRALVATKPADIEFLGYALYLVDAIEGLESALVFARELRDQAPDVLERHLHYQSMMRWAGRSDAVREEYRERYAKNQNSPMAGVLLYRVEKEEDGAARALLDSLVQRFPDDVLVIEWAGRRAFLEGRYSESAALFAKLEGAPRQIRIADEHAHALVAMKRIDDARALIRRLASAQKAPDAFIRMTYAKLGRLSGADARTSLDTISTSAAGPKTSDTSEGAISAWALSAIGENVSSAETAGIQDKPTRSAIDIQLAAARDPGAAWEACAAAPPAALRRLDLKVAVLLGAEFARVGDMRMAERLLGPREELGLPSSRLFDYVLSGVEHPDLKYLNPEIRAALAMVRARKLAESNQEHDELWDRAGRDDVLQGIVTRAMTNWPAISKMAPAGSKNGLATSKNALAVLEGAPAGSKGGLAVLQGVEKEKVLVLVKKKGEDKDLAPGSGQ